MVATERLPEAAFLEPMACKLVATLPTGPDWLYEFKWDGYRALGGVWPRGTALYSRQQKSFSRTFPEVQGALAALRCRSAIVDGEVVAITADGRPSFRELQKTRNRTAALQYMVFDLLSLDGKDCRRLMLAQRRALLAKIIPEGGIIRLSPELPSQPAALMEQARAAGLEGIVAKKRDSFYEEGERSGSWVKWKAERSETFLVGGYVPNGSTFDELIIGQLEGNRLRYVARVNAGFVPATRRAVMEAVKDQRIEQCPFYNLPEPKAARWGRGLTADEMRKCRWAAASIKVKVGFVEWTDARHLRHARFLSLA